MNDELKISETIYDQGTFTGLERLEKKKKLKRIQMLIIKYTFLSNNNFQKTFICFIIY